MKETTRASIGGFAFNIDFDALESLTKYLEELSQHYKKQEEGEEILNDIESRMSELLRMKLTYPERIVTISDTDEIIKTMGKPHELFDDEENNSYQEKKYSNQKIIVDNSLSSQSDWRKKRLYRDMDNKVIGGVCSGLGHYFRIDPVLVRIIFVLVLIITNLISPNLSLTAVAIYFIFLIAMPKAETMSDKIVMTRTNPTVEGIANREHVYQSKSRGTGIVNVLVIIFKIIVGGTSLLIGLSVLFSTIVATLSLATNAVFIAKYTYASPLLGFGITEISTPLLIFLFTFGGMFTHFGIKLLFSKLKLSDFIILCIAAIICFSSLFYLSISLRSEAINYKRGASEIENIVIPDSTRTLYINLNNNYQDFSSISKVFSLYKNEDDDSWFRVPSVIIVKDSTQIKTEIFIEKKFYAKNKHLAQQLAKESKLNYEFRKDSLLISPDLKHYKSKWDRSFYKIIIKPGKNFDVKVSEPIKTFNTNNYDYNSKLGEFMNNKNYTFNLMFDSLDID